MPKTLLVIELATCDVKLQTAATTDGSLQTYKHVNNETHQYTTQADRLASHLI